MTENPYEAPQDAYEPARDVSGRTWFLVKIALARLTSGALYLMAAASVLFAAVALTEAMRVRDASGSFIAAAVCLFAALLMALLAMKIWRWRPAR